MARVDRNGQTESWHYGAAAVATPAGRLVARVGDPSLSTYLRSAAKPFQALPLVEAGGLAAFGLEPADLALICASHGGTPAHTWRAETLLELGGFTLADLSCGAHEPLDRTAARALRETGLEPTPLHNNCSGKHAGMLLACRLNDWPPAGYLLPEHPLQRRILALVALLCGVEEETIGLAVDGCSVPTYRLPLAAAARAYAALADPLAAGLAPELASALQTVVDAMTEVPEMVAGPGRFTTRLMEVTGGRLLGKEGAEGIYGVAIRGPVALGLMLKIADGDDRARDGVVLDLLLQLGSLSAEELAELASFHRPEVRNRRHLLVGEVVPDVELEEVAEGDGGGSP